MLLCLEVLKFKMSTDNLYSKTDKILFNHLKNNLKIFTYTNEQYGGLHAGN